MSDILFVRRNIKGLALAGFWQYRTYKNPVKNILFYLYSKLVYFYFVTFVTTQFIEMLRVVNDIPVLMGNAGVTLLYMVTCLKGYTLHYRKNRINKLLDVIRKAEVQSNLYVVDKKIYSDCVRRNLYNINLFWTVVFVTILAFFIARPLEYFFLGPQEIHAYKVPLLFSSWFPFDKFADGYFELAYFWQVLSGCIGAYCIAVVDTFLVGCMIFSIGQFKIVQNRIKELHLDAQEEELNESGLIERYQRVVDIIKEHNGIIDFLIDLDGLINPIIFAAFLTCSLLICAVGMEGIMSGLSVRFVLDMEYLTALLIQLFMYYWHANEVSLESMNIGRAVAESHWYRFSAKMKQGLMMVMIRSQKPVTLSVGGFYEMSLSTFIMILKTTYSFLALFRKVYAKGQHD